MGYFKVISVKSLNEAKEGDIFHESDYSSLTPDGKFVQMEYVDEDDRVIEPTVVKPGVFCIVKTMQGLKLDKTAYTEESILKDFVNTKNITDKVDMFFNKLDVYYRYGMGVPKRGGLLWGDPGCHAKGTRILMYDGSIKNVEDVLVGDLLMGPDSKPREVLKLARGSEPMVKITPVKGDSFIVNINHILHLTPSGKGLLSQTPINMKVCDFLKQKNNFTLRYKLTRTGVDFSNNDTLNIPPYILGTWLGDGTSACTSITTMDNEIYEEWNNYANSIGCELKIKAKKGKATTYSVTTGNNKGQKVSGRNQLLTQLQKYNIFNNKHIPIQYLTSSRADRLMLLAGIIDTDGHLGTGYFDLILKNEKLMDDVIYLSRSLGFSCYKKQTTKSCLYKGEKREGIYYRISICGNISEIPTKLPRKKANMRGQIKDVLRTGFTVEHLGVGDYYGFSLDGDHLYMTDDFTIHHNTGKSTAIAELANQYGSDGKTFVLLWHTDKLDASDVKDFVKSFEYHSVERMILVVEDIGGIEADNMRIQSESSLLSLLDNKESTFKIPVYILATTNYAHSFQQNLTQRKGRFDDILNIGLITGEARESLLRFFDKDNLLTEEAITLIKSKKCDKFTPAHLREVIVRSAIFDQPVVKTINDMLKEIKEFQNQFQERKSLGMGMYED